MWVEHTLHLHNPTKFNGDHLSDIDSSRTASKTRSRAKQYYGLIYLSLNAVTGNKSANVGFRFKLPNREVSELFDFIEVRLYLLRNLGTNSQKKTTKRKQSL